LPPLPLLPPGFVVYEERVLAVDVRHGAALRLGRARRRRLHLARDGERLRLDGEWRGLWLRHRAPVGYLPDDVAGRVLGSGIPGLVIPRFLATLVDALDGSVELLLQIAGPASGRRHYGAADPPRTLAARPEPRTPHPRPRLTLVED
jgi:hypothetical protein